MQFVSVTVAPRGTLDLKLFSVTSLLTPLPVADWVLARAPLLKSKRPANSPINTFIAINSTHLLLASKQRAEENFKFDQYHIQAKGLIQPEALGLDRWQATPIGALIAHPHPGLLCFLALTKSRKLTSSNCKRLSITTSRLAEYQAHEIWAIDCDSQQQIFLRFCSVTTPYIGIKM